MQGYLQFTFIHHADLLSLTRVRCRTPVHFQFTMLIYAHLDFASNSPMLIHHDLGPTRLVHFQFTMLIWAHLEFTLRLLQMLLYVQGDRTDY